MGRIFIKFLGTTTTKETGDDENNNCNANEAGDREHTCNGSCVREKSGNALTFRFGNGWIDIAALTTYPEFVVLDAGDVVDVSVCKLKVNVDVLSGIFVVGKICVGAGVVTVSDKEELLLLLLLDLLLGDVLVIVTIEIEEEEGEGEEEEDGVGEVEGGVDVDVLVGVVLDWAGVDADFDLITQCYNDR